jgi:hypothetical protein
MMTLSDTIQSILDTATADPTTGVPGLAFAAVDKNGSVLTANASGKRGPSSEQTMTPDTVVWMASFTKLITAIAALQLVEQGKLHLDDTEEVGNFSTTVWGPLIINWSFRSSGSTQKLTTLNALIKTETLLNVIARFRFGCY